MNVIETIRENAPALALRAIVGLGIGAAAGAGLGLAGDALVQTDNPHTETINEDSMESPVDDFAFTFGVLGAAANVGAGLSVLHVREAEAEQIALRRRRQAGY